MAAVVRLVIDNHWFPRTARLPDLPLPQWSARTVRLAGLPLLGEQIELGDGTRAVVSQVEPCSDGIIAGEIRATLAP